jgi:hypothetical protein
VTNSLGFPSSENLFILHALLFFPFSPILLAYISCIQGIHMCACFHAHIQCIPIKSIPSITPTHPFSPFLGTISTGFIVLFLHVYRIYTPHSLSFLPPPPAGTHPKIPNRTCLAFRLLVFRARVHIERAFLTLVYFA